MIKDIYTFDGRKYVSINTTEYNEDAQAGIIVSDFEDLESLGWDVVDYDFKNMEIGDIVHGQRGALLIRIA